MTKEDIKKGNVIKHFKKESDTWNMVPNNHLYMVEGTAIDMDSNDFKVIVKALFYPFNVMIVSVEDMLAKVDKDRYPDTKQRDVFELVLENDELSSKKLELAITNSQI